MSFQNFPYFMTTLPLIFLSHLNAQQIKPITYNSISKIDISKPLENDAFKNAKKFDFSIDSNTIELLANLSKSTSIRTEGAAPHAVLGHLLKAQPEQCFEWILDHYSLFNTHARCNIVVALRKMNNQENHQLLVFQLDDRDLIVNSHSAETAPLPYWDMRVCDTAYNSLVQLLRNEQSFPDEIPRSFFPSTPPDIRDKSIEILRNWWRKSSQTILLKKISLGATRTSIFNKMQSLVTNSSPKNSISIK